MSRKRTKPKVETIDGYTVMQTQFLRGEISVNEVDGRFFKHLLDSAKKANDEELIATSEALLKKCKKEKEQRQIELKRARIRNDTIPLKAVKKRAYRKKELELISRVKEGTIDVRGIHGNTLQTIAAVAQAIDDQETYEIFYSLYCERMHEKARSFFALKNKGGDGSGENPEDYERRTKLTSWEKGVLECTIDLDQCTLRHLEHIVKVVEDTQDEKYLEVAKLMLRHKKDPMTAINKDNEKELLYLLNKILDI